MTFAPLQPSADAALNPARSTQSNLIRRTCSCDGSTKEKCAACSGDLAGRVGVQAKLLIGAVDDPMEREADAIADSIARSSDSSSTPSSDPLQGTSAPQSVTDVLSFGGQPLQSGTREAMESHFDRDFSRVRVHADRAAHRSAESIAARAYTAGTHIVFGEGAYAPATDEGRHLLAHELTHVAQQEDG